MKNFGFLSVLFGVALSQSFPAFAGGVDDLYFSVGSQANNKSYTVKDVAAVFTLDLSAFSSSFPTELTPPAPAPRKVPVLAPVSDQHAADMKALFSNARASDLYAGTPERAQFMAEVDAIEVALGRIQAGDAPLRADEIQRMGMALERAYRIHGLEDIFRMPTTYAELVACAHPKMPKERQVAYYERNEGVYANGWTSILESDTDRRSYFSHHESEIYEGDKKRRLYVPSKGGLLTEAGIMLAVASGLWLYSYDPEGDHGDAYGSYSADGYKVRSLLAFLAHDEGHQKQFSTTTVQGGFAFMPIKEADKERRRRQVQAPAFYALRTLQVRGFTSVDAHVLFNVFHEGYHTPIDYFMKG